VLRWKVSCLGKDLFEFFVGKHSRLFETVHGSADYNVDISIGGNDDVEVVLVNGLLGDSR